jgi:cysteine synthase A
MILDAEERGLINKDTVIIEPTSGNTGIGFSLCFGCQGIQIDSYYPENNEY